MSFAINVVNTQTGQSAWIDPKVARLARMRRRVKAWAEAIQFLHTSNTRLVMITLTYAEVDGWEANHIRDYCKAMVNRLGDGLLAWAWVAELQHRGAVHYHLYMLVRKGTKVPKPDESGLWPHGHSNIQTGRSVWYLVKYVGKEYQKEGPFPKGMRIFSVAIRAKDVPMLAISIFKWSTLPKWMRENMEALKGWGLGVFPKRAPGGGYLVTIPGRRTVTGEDQEVWYPNPWIVISG